MSAPTMDGTNDDDGDDLRPSGGAHRLEDAAAIGVVRASMVGLSVQPWRHRRRPPAERTLALILAAAAVGMLLILLGLLWPIL